MARGRTKAPIPPLDLSKYSNEERLPPNVIAIIKNALVIFNCNTERISKHYKLPKEKIDLIYEENYLQINQLLDAKTKSKELDTGIDNSILLITEHINTLQKHKSADIMNNTTVNNVVKLTDRMVALKQQYNNTYDTIVNKMLEQQLKERAVVVQESGKLEDNSEYLENQNTVAKMLEQYTSRKERKITLVNVKTYETKIFTAYKDADEFLGTNGHLRDVAQRKVPYKNEWLVSMDD